jgi:hypothetical protein
MMYLRKLTLFLYYAFHALGQVCPITKGRHSSLSLALTTIPSVAGLLGSCVDSVCGRFLFFDLTSVRRFKSDACEQKCVFYLFFVVFRFLGLEPGWECGTCDDGTTLVAADGPTTDFTVASCDSDTLTVQGDLIGSLKIGNKVVYVDDTDTCTDCNKIFRKIVSIQDGTDPQSKILTTAFLTVNDVFGPNSYDTATSETAVETLLDCEYGDSGRARLLLPAADPDNVGRNLLGECNADWIQKNADGRCSKTNCFVGKNGDPNNCFECGTTCDNGCGSGAFKFDGDFFGLYDFGLACCNHDHCWSSTDSRESCDRAFLQDMLQACPPKSPSIFQFGPRACKSDANLFYAIVRSFIGTFFHKGAQEKQNKYEGTPVCIAQCPSTQESGGQGTTRLTIDLLRSSGVFPVSYNMYTIPDQLIITYEGQTIFDTGGLVSGSLSTTVSFSGTSTIIQVTINAPQDGTAWDVFVGCPTNQ